MAHYIVLVAYFFIGYIGHDLHMSKCDIKYNTETESIQISMRVFLDDLEASLKKDGYEELKILTKKEHPSSDSLIIDYLKKHFQVYYDDKTAEPFYLGKEISEDYMAMWCYLEIENVDRPKSITIVNDILTELFDDQQNIVSIKVDSKQKGFKLLDNEVIKTTISL